MRRTIGVLTALSQAPDGMGVTRLADQLGESPSTVHRLLSALVEHDYVVRDADRRYRLGVGVLGLAHAFQRQDRLVTVAQPHLSSLVAETRESVFLAELIGDDVICVASAESPRLLSFYMRLGQRTPYHAASSARAILAFKSPAEQVRLLRAERLDLFTPRTPDSLAAAAAALEQTRADGYAVCDEEMEIGVVALSVPVLSPTGSVDASLTLVAPQDRLAGSARTEIARLLADASRELSAELGYRPDDARRSTGTDTDGRRDDAGNLMARPAAARVG